MKSEEAEWHWICTLKTHADTHGHINPYAMNTAKVPHTGPLVSKWKADLLKLENEKKDMMYLLTQLEQRESNLKEKLSFL